MIKFPARLAASPLKGNIMKKKIFKKILDTKTGGLIFKIMVGPPMLAFGLIGLASVWLGAKNE